MLLIKPSFEIMGIYGSNGIGRDALQLIERAGRTCYKSEDKITRDSCMAFVKMINKNGHHSVLEHSAMTVKFICDRGISHELVRHRLASYSQESSRYCNYKGGVTFIIPPWIDIKIGEYKTLFPKPAAPDDISWEWYKSVFEAERTYLILLRKGLLPEQARSVLPNSLKTEVIMTCNLREWRHVFALRCNKKAHPQMRELMLPLRSEAQKLIPVIFD